MRTGKLLSVLLVAMLVIGGVGPVLALPFDSSPATSGAAAQQAAQNESNVSVTVGAQLSTVMSATGDGIQAEFDDEVFEKEIDGKAASKQAEIVAKRIDSLDKRAQKIRAEYEDVSAKYEDGKLTRSQYAQRLAMLNARADNVLHSIERTKTRLDSLSDLELTAAGANRTTLRGAAISLEPITGPGASALHKRFVGETNGTVHLETGNGLTISVEKADNNRSRTMKHQRDDDNSVSVSQGDALAAARNALKGPKDGWKLAKASVNNDRGYYAFQFMFNSNSATGEATVLVDGSTGTVFSLDEELKRGTEKDTDKDKTPKHDELALVVARGTPAPNQDVTLQALSNGQAAADVVITVNGERVGTTNADGLLTLTLPAGHVQIEGVRGDAKGELELEFEAKETDRKQSVLRDLDASATIENGFATVKVTYKGEAIPGALVYANGREVGRTNTDGIVEFETDAKDELDIEIAKGSFGAGFTFTVSDGNATLDGGARASDKKDTGNDDTSDSPTTDTDKDRDTNEEKSNNGNGNGPDENNGNGTDHTPGTTAGDHPDESENGTDDLLTTTPGVPIVG